MATADEMLSTILDENYIFVDVATRAIAIPNTIANLGVESDDDVLSLPFKFNRRIGNIDLSEFKVRVNYLNARQQGDMFEPEDVTIGEDGYITFTWTVGRFAAAYKGNVSFNVCLKKYDKEDPSIVIQEFNSTIAILPVLEGLETSEQIAAVYADILEAWRTELFAIYDNIEKAVDDYIASLGDVGVISVNGEKGNVTVTPEKIGAAKADHNHNSTIANNLDTTEEGYVLDARQGKELKAAVDGKLPKTGGEINGNLVFPNGGNVIFMRDDIAYRPIINADQYGQLSMYINDEDNHVVKNQLIMLIDGWSTHIPFGVHNGGTGATNRTEARKNLGAASVKKTSTVFPKDGWSSSAPYTQTISVDDVLATDNPRVEAYPYASDNDISALGRYEAWACVHRIVAGDGTLTAYCYEEKPTSSIPIIVEIVR